MNNKQQERLDSLMATERFIITFAQSMSHPQNVERGLAYLEQELARNPQRQWFYYLQGRFLANYLDRYEDGLKAFDQAIQMDAQDELALYYKGRALHELKRYEEALQIYDQSLEAIENNVGYLAEGEVLDELERYEELALYYKGQALYELKRYEEALQVYDQALELQEDNVTYIAKGEVLCHLQQYEEALQAAEESLDILELVDAWNLKGQALVGLGRYADALAAYDQALHLEPENKEAYEQKGEILLKLSPAIPPQKYREKIRNKIQKLRKHKK